MAIQLEDHHLSAFITEELFLVNEKGGNERSNEITKIIKEEKKEKKEAKIDQMLVISEPLIPSTKETLEKIITALKLNIDSIALEETWPENFTKHEKIIIFGFQDKCESIGFNQNYKVFSFEDSEIVTSKSISFLDENKDEKYILWEALKKWFNLRA